MNRTMHQCHAWCTDYRPPRLHIWMRAASAERPQAAGERRRRWGAGGTPAVPVHLATCSARQCCLSSRRCWRAPPLLQPQVPDQGRRCVVPSTADDRAGGVAACRARVAQQRLRRRRRQPGKRRWAGACGTPMQELATTLPCHKASALCSPGSLSVHGGAMAVSQLLHGAAAGCPRQQTRGEAPACALRQTLLCIFPSPLRH